MSYQNISLFKGMNSSDVDELIAGVAYQKKKFKKGDLVVLAGSECINLKIILSGSVHSEMYGENDKVINLAKITSGRAIAVAFLFGQNNYMPVDVIADEDTEILVLPKDTVLSITKTHNQFLTNLLNEISTQTQFLSQKIRFLNFSTLREKLIFYIKQEEKKQKTDWIQLTKTQQQLAEAFGATRPSIARVFKDLTDERVISFDGPKRLRLNV